MNDRRKRFAEYYAACGNAAEAARRACYSEHTARSQGQRLLTDGDIRNYVQELQEKAEAGRVATLTEVKELWTAAMRDKTEKTSNRLRAGELLARSAGIFVGSTSGTREDKGEEFPATPHNQDAVIALPWNGQGVVNAIENEDGEIVPLSGAGETDTLVYLPHKFAEQWQSQYSSHAGGNYDKSALE